VRETSPTFSMGNYLLHELSSTEDVHTYCLDTPWCPLAGIIAFLKKLLLNFNMDIYSFRNFELNIIYSNLFLSKKV
jgi:hypothetical protein